jgi:hypothetical protein
MKPSGTTVNPTIAATRAPNRSVNRPASGISGMVSRVIDPISAKSARDQPNSLSMAGPSRFIV